jgi:hypothetical protein
MVSSCMVVLITSVALVASLALAHEVSRHSCCRNTRPEHHRRLGDDRRVEVWEQCPFRLGKGGGTTSIIAHPFRLVTPHDRRAIVIDHPRPRRERRYRSMLLIDCTYRRQVPLMH